MDGDGVRRQRYLDELVGVVEQPNDPARISWVSSAAVGATDDYAVGNALGKLDGPTEEVGSRHVVRMDEQEHCEHDVDGHPRTAR